MPASAAGRPAGDPSNKPSNGDPGNKPGNGKSRGVLRGVIITICGALITAGIVTAAVVPGLIGACAERYCSRHSHPRPGNIEGGGGRCEKLQGAAGIDRIGETARHRQWHGPHPLGILSVAAVPSHRRPAAYRHSLSGALRHRPRSSFTRRRCRRRVVLPHPWLVPPGIEGHGFHQCPLDTREPMLTECRTGKPMLREC